MSSQPPHRLVLLVAGSGLPSRQATANLRRICDEHLTGGVDLQIIDIRERPELAQAYQVVAVPTLLRLAPGPVRRIIGDLSQMQRVLDCLEISDPR